MLYIIYTIYDMITHCSFYVLFTIFLGDQEENYDITRL